MMAFLNVFVIKGLLLPLKIFFLRGAWLLRSLNTLEFLIFIVNIINVL